MANRNAITAHNLQNFTLKNLLKCTTELGKVYEVFLQRILRKLEEGQSISLADIKGAYKQFHRETLDVAEQCSLMFPFHE
jgi:ABC-type Zn2+ transport system substrate-binding protein/surface adhesin